MCDYRISQLTINTLVFAFLVDIVEVPEHFQSTRVRARIVNDSFATMLYNVL